MWLPGQFSARHLSARQCPEYENMSPQDNDSDPAHRNTNINSNFRAIQETWPELLVPGFCTILGINYKTTIKGWLISVASAICLFSLYSLFLFFCFFIFCLFCLFCLFVVFLRCSLYFSPFAKQNPAEVWPIFQSLLKLLLWTKGVEWVKVLNALGLSCI